MRIGFIGVLAGTAGAALVAEPALAADVPYGANLLALGNTGAANPHDNAALALNPGVLGLVERYDFQAQFRYGPTGDLQWGLSGMDARSARLSGGFAYSGDRFEPALRPEDLPGWHVVGEEVRNRRRLHDLAFALALPLADRRVSMGLGSTVSWYDHDLEGKGVGFDLHAGVGVRPVDALTVGLAVRNWLPLGGVDRPTSAVAGVRVEGGEVFAFEANTEWIPRQPASLQEELPLVVAAGAEVAPGSGRLRVGGRRDVGGQLWITGGLGWEKDGTAIEYGIQVPTTSPLSDRSLVASTVHGVQIRFEAPPDLREPD